MHEIDILSSQNGCLCFCLERFRDCLEFIMDKGPLNVPLNKTHICAHTFIHYICCLTLAWIKFNLPARLMLSLRLPFHVPWRFSSVFLFLTHPKNVFSVNVNTSRLPCLLTHQHRKHIYYTKPTFLEHLILNLSLVKACPFEMRVFFFFFFFLVHLIHNRY